MPFYATDSMTLDDIKALVAKYPSVVKDNLKDLDEFRYETLPERVKGRRVYKGMGKKAPADLTYMSKDELVELVTWKLKHGTFRPKLKQLVESNDEETIDGIFRDIEATKGTPTSSREVMQMLTKLKGIGPATASLVMSVIKPLEYPFFSDELFRWIHWDGLNADGTSAGIKNGKGWSRPIGYTPKEYESLITRCNLLQARLSDPEKPDEEFSFFEMEKAAYVLGKEKMEIESAPDTDEGTTTKTFNEEKNAENAEKRAEKVQKNLKKDDERIKKRVAVEMKSAKGKKRSSPPSERTEASKRPKRQKKVV